MRIIFFLLIILSSCTKLDNSSVEKNQVKHQDVVEKSSVNVDNAPIIHKKYKIALLLPINHPKYGNIAIAMRDSIMMRANEIDDKDIDIILYNYQNDEEVLISSQRAKKQGVDVIVGPLLTKTTAIVSDIMKDTDIPIISFSNQHNSNYQNVITYGYNIDSQIHKVVEFLEKKDIEKVGILYLSSGQNNTLTDIIKNTALTKDIQLQNLKFNYNGDDEEQAIDAEIINEALLNSKSALILRGGDKKLFEKLTKHLDIQKIQANNTLVLCSSFHNIIQDASINLNGVYHIDNIMEENLQKYNQYILKFKTQYGYIPPQIANLAYNIFDIIYQKKHHDIKITKENLINQQFIENTGKVVINSLGFAEREAFIHQIASDNAE